jgi:hypothetical protein
MLAGHSQRASNASAATCEYRLSSINQAGTRGLRFGLSLLSAFVYSSVRCSSLVGCCFALITSPLSTVHVTTAVLLKRTDWLLGFGSPSLHVGSHPLAPGAASCCPASVAVSPRPLVLSVYPQSDLQFTRSIKIVTLMLEVQYSMLQATT